MSKSWYRLEQFGLSVNQVSSDPNRYISFSPDNMTYDKSARTYVRGPAFKSVFGKLDAGRYLTQLRSVGLDTDSSAKRPQDQRIVLLNREVVDANY